MSINDEFDKVKSFHRLFKHSISDTPIFMELDRAEKRANWMMDEIDEFVEAENIQEQVDAIIDLMYFAIGTLVELGVPPKIPFSIVHESNMTKIDPSVGPIYREDGKVLKSENWQAPEQKLEDYIYSLTKSIVDRQEHEDSGPYKDCVCNYCKEK